MCSGSDELWGKYPKSEPDRSSFTNGGSSCPGDGDIVRSAGEAVEFRDEADEALALASAAACSTVPV